MAHAERTITINRPVEQVFAFLTEPENDPSWRPQVKEIAAEGPLAVGSRIHQVVAGPGGRGIPADMEVTAYEPPARFDFRVVAGPARPTGSFRFIEVPGGTEVTFTLAAELRGLKGRVMSGPVQRSMDSEMAALDVAKSQIEGS